MLPPANDPAGRWPMPPLVRASLGLHALALGTVLVAPAAWPWVAGAVGLNHALLGSVGLWPRSRGVGANLRHLCEAGRAGPEVAITIDDGPDAGITPAVLDLLDRHDTRATFFCIARQARAHPGLVREIVARGHSVQNHSLNHSHAFALLGPRRIAAEIDDAQAILADITGERPTCFRAPAGLRNPFLDPLLARRGLRLVSWTRRGFDTRDASAERVVARLARGLAAGDILLLHDRHSARGPGQRPVVLDVLPALLGRLRQAGLAGVTLPQALGTARAVPFA